MKKSTTKDYAIALCEATQELKGKDLELVLKNFVELLYKKQKLKKAGQIIKEFVQHAKKKEGIMNIEVTSARKLETKTLNHIKNAFGEEVEAREKVDEWLLGGFIVKTEDKIFDGSLRKQLLRLKQNLI